LDVARDFLALIPLQFTLPADVLHRSEQVLLLKASENVQQRGLAGTGRSHDRCEFTAFEDTVQALEDLFLRSAISDLDLVRQILEMDVDYSCRVQRDGCVFHRHVVDTIEPLREYYCYLLAAAFLFLRCRLSAG